MQGTKNSPKTAAIEDKAETQWCKISIFVQNSNPKNFDFELKIVQKYQKMDFWTFEFFNKNWYFASLCEKKVTSSINNAVKTFIDMQAGDLTVSPKGDTE